MKWLWPSLPYTQWVKTPSYSYPLMLNNSGTSYLQLPQVSKVRDWIDVKEIYAYHPLEQPYKFYVELELLIQHNIYYRCMINVTTIIEQTVCTTDFWNAIDCTNIKQTPFPFRFCIYMVLNLFGACMRLKWRSPVDLYLVSHHTFCS